MKRGSYSWALTMVKQIRLSKMSNALFVVVPENNVFWYLRGPDQFGICGDPYGLMNVSASSKESPNWHITDYGRLVGSAPFATKAELQVFTSKPESQLLWNVTE